MDLEYNRIKTKHKTASTYQLSDQHSSIETAAVLEFCDHFSSANEQ